MKRLFSLLSLAIVLAAPVGPARAIDLSTNAVVTIVEGITITETQQLNFGTLVLNSGVVTVSTAGVITDPASLTADGTSQWAAEFTVQTPAGVTIGVALTPGVQPTGLTLGAMNFDIGGGTTAGTYTTVATSTPLLVGADLTVDRTSANLGASQQLPYTVSVTFQ